METHRRELQEHQRKKRSNKCMRVVSNAAMVTRQTGRDKESRAAMAMAMAMVVEKIPGDVRLREQA